MLDIDGEIVSISRVTGGVPTQLERRFHAYWTPTGTLPEHLAANLQRWRELHPNWRFTLWDDTTIPPLRHQRFFDDPQRWSPSSHPGQYRANLLRYELLWQYGGVWVDCDLEPLRPIDPLIEDVTCFAGYETQGVWINNCIIGATPHHPAIAEILDGIPASITQHPGWRSNRQTGAQYITPILTRRSDVTIFDRRLVMPYSWADVKTSDWEPAEEFPDAYCVHAWANRRRQLAAKGK